MNFGEAIVHNIRNCLSFSGRDPRSSFWWYVLFVFLGSIMANTIDTMLWLFRLEELASLTESPEQIFETFFGNPMTFFWVAPVSFIWMAINLVPLFSCGMRRRHDRGKSGTFFAIVCVLGAAASAVGLYFMFQVMDLFSTAMIANLQETDLENVELPDADVLASMTRLMGITSITSLVQFGAGVIIFIMMVSKGTDGANAYGPDPLAAEKAQAGFPT